MFATRSFWDFSRFLSCSIGRLSGSIGVDLELTRGFDSPAVHSLGSLSYFWKPGRDSAVPARDNGSALHGAIISLPRLVEIDSLENNVACIEYQGEGERA